MCDLSDKFDQEKLSDRQCFATISECLKNAFRSIFRENSITALFHLDFKKR